MVPSCVFRSADQTQSGGDDIGRDFEARIARMKAELEKVVPNMKAIDRWVVLPVVALMCKIGGRADWFRRRRARRRGREAAEQGS